MRRTKIICTMGPAVNNEEMIEQLIKHGMNCARFNFSHGDHEEQSGRMQLVRNVRARLNAPVAILLDTKGPEIRLKDFKDGSVILKKGQTFTLDADEKTLGDETRIGLTFPTLAENVKVEDVILIDDGKIGLIVKKIEEDKVICKVTNGGKVSNHKSINVPGVEIKMSYLSEVDKADILFGIHQDVDFIAASFVRCGEDVRELRKLLNENGGEKINIISKVENMQGIKNLDEIIEESDGVMVARGDLGVEIPYKEVPATQKQIIKNCLAKGKIVITATQMLDSMTHAPRPTRAEVSDVANAIYDGSTAIMLSGETANGDYPIEAVSAMDEIARYTEQFIDFTLRVDYRESNHKKSKCNAICIASCNAAAYLEAKAIVVMTKSGRTAKLLASYKPVCPIYALTVSNKGFRQLNLSWGVTPIQADNQENSDELFAYASKKAVSMNLVKKGETIVVIAGVDEFGETDMLRIMTA